MSNIKKVQLTAQVGFDFVYDDKLAMMFGRLMANPFMGVKVIIHPTGRYKKNSNGGQTAQVGISITGEEALSSSFLEYLVEKLKRFGSVRCRYKDLEDGINKWAYFTEEK